MEIIVTSRGMKASDILDLAFDMGLERPKIATAGEWDGGRIHILTYGPLAYRRTLEIPAPAQKERVTALLQDALRQQSEKLPAIVAPIQEEPKAPKIMDAPKPAHDRKRKAKNAPAGP